MSNRVMEVELNVVSSRKVGRGWCNINMLVLLISNVYIFDSFKHMHMHNFNKNKNLNLCKKGNVNLIFRDMEVNTKIINWIS